MNWTVRETMILIGVLFALLVAFDVLVFAVYGADPTISRAMYWISREWKLVIVVWGGLAAHFFMVQDGHWCGWWQELKPVLLLAFWFIVFRLSWVQVIGK